MMNDRPDFALENTLVNLAHARQELAELLKPLRPLKAEIKDLDKEARGLAMQRFYHTKDPKPAEGVEIQQMRAVTGIDSPAMMDWCMKKAQHLIIVNVRAAGKAKMAQQLINVGAPIKVSYLPKVKLATDLSYWLDRKPQGLDDG